MHTPIEPIALLVRRSCAPQPSKLDDRNRAQALILARAAAARAGKACGMAEGKVGMFEPVAGYVRTRGGHHLCLMVDYYVVESVTGPVRVRGCVTIFTDRSSLAWVTEGTIMQADDYVISSAEMEFSVSSQAWEFATARGGL